MASATDGFDYFRGWLILQGREVFEHIVADPDALADLPVIRAQAPGAAYLECEDTLYIASRAYRAATGEELPPHPFRSGTGSWTPHGTSTSTIEQG